MSYLTDAYSANDAAPNATPRMDGEDDSNYSIPEVPSYLVGADNHQLGNTGSSILDPSTWGDRIDNGFKFSVSAITRAVASTYNSAIQVGELAGITDDSDKASTKEWLQSMDDDLSQYYQKNQASIDTVGDAIGMFAPGFGGIKVFNWAQKGIALATEGRAGLSMAAHFGTLASKQAYFAKLAAADMASSTSVYSAINVNLAKSLATGYAQNALEFAAFDTAASITMGKDSPLFQNHDASDIAYNALLGGGMIGAGIMGTATAARTLSAIKEAGNVVDKETNAWRTVLTEPTDNTPANEKLAIHLNNIEAIPTVATDDPLLKLKQKGVAETTAAELDNGRLAAHAMTGGDIELGNNLFNTLLLADSEDASAKLAGAVNVTRAGIATEQEIAVTKLRDQTALEAAVTDAQNKLASLDVGTSDYTKAQMKLDAAKYRADLNMSKAQDIANSGLATRYIKLTGEDAGTIFDAAPTLHLADIASDEKDVMARVASYGHKQGQDWNVVAASGDVNSIEARYIAAQESTFNPDIKIGNNDIPFLEKAYQEMNTNPNISEVTLKDGMLLDKPALYKYLTELKGTEANRLQDINALSPSEKALNTYDIAKLVNVSPDYLNGSLNIARSEKSFLAMQSDAIAYTQKQIAAGNWRADKGLIKTYLQPQYAKVVYDITKAQETTGHVIDGMTHLKEQQAVYKQQAINTTNAYLGEDASLYPEHIDSSLLQNANRSSVGGGLFTSMNAGYKTLASYMQQIGATTAALLAKKASNAEETFAASGHALLNDPKAGTEFWKTIQQLRQTPEKYSFVEGRGLVNIKQLDYEEALANAADPSKIAAPIFEDTRAPVEIPFESEGMNNWAKQWDDYHKKYNQDKMNLRNSQGLTISNNLSRVFYVPPVDVRNFPHFAFVVDDSISGTGHISTIHANTAADLEALAAKVPTETGLKVIYKDQSERWHQAMKDYDYDLGINENYIDSALYRSGVSGSYFPITDPKVLFEDMMKWRKNQDAGLLRDMLEHRYSPEFAELRRQGAQYDLAVNSKTGYIPDILKAKQSNPYNDYIKAALYEQRQGVTPIWNAINRLAETSVSTAASKLQDTFKTVKTQDDLELINKELQSIGCNAYTDAATYALANHTAPKPVLSNWIRKANSLLTFTMLRADPMNALNNGFGHAVLYGTELPAMIQDIFGKTGQKLDMAHITVPGTSTQVLSPAKLAANAYADWFTNIVGKEDKGALYNYFKKLNVLPSYTEQFGNMMESLTLKGTESAAELDSRMANALAAAKKFGDTAEKVTGNRFAEEMNRYVAAHTANAVADEAIRQGVLLPELKASIINTFVNRTQGVTLAAQRPMLFRGPVGQAVGLFQTYQFNMLQQLFRYVGSGDTKRVATLLGLQGSVYGLNGLPAFNAMNNYLVGNAAGNASHKDIITTTYDAAGQELGDWLLYGMSSNFLLHPDAKVNLYSRGDINPRQVTVIPTSLADVPIVGAASKFFGSLYEAGQKMNKGADMWPSFLQGLEHSGISRPLAGFAQAMEASTNPAGKVFSTDNSGNIVMQNDLFSIMTAARIVGAKPLDEARTLDAYHRVTVYEAADKARIENLGEGIKATVAGGNIPSQEQINGFMAEYMKAGGKQQGFNQFWTRQVLAANQSKVNQMINNVNNPAANYMQRIMGGYQLSDFINNSNK